MKHGYMQFSLFLFKLRIVLSLKWKEGGKSKIEPLLHLTTLLRITFDFENHV